MAKSFRCPDIYNIERNGSVYQRDNYLGASYGIADNIHEHIAWVNLAGKRVVVKSFGNLDNIDWDLFRISLEWS